ncbi:MAG: hypothetical protein M3R49_03505 [Chloroflexota bacterium]|nr:hypothetical protein [Chloroflexota bacterium]
MATKRSVLLVDARKFTMSGVVRVCGAAELDAVVTDPVPDEVAPADLIEAGVEVVRA